MKIHEHLVEKIIGAWLEIFEQKVFADKVIEKRLKIQKKWGSRDRKFFAESVYEGVRWWRHLWALLGEDPSMDPEQLKRLWALWAWQQGLMQNPERWGLDPDQIRKNEIWVEKKAPRAIRESIPDWMDELGMAELQRHWPLVLTALNEKAPVDLRVNALKAKPELVKLRLHEEGIETEYIEGVPMGLTLVERRNVFAAKIFQQGLFEVQDRASQLVAPLLDPQPGDRVIDACAGGGGKTLHMAALMKNKGKILSLDIHDWKLEQLKLRAKRAGADLIETRVIDSTKVIKRLEQTADRLLLDVPCSGMGVLRRNPDAKWKLSLAEIERLQKVQEEILSGYSKMVKPGGVLVYATCSILPRENHQQIEKFLQNPGWTLIEEVSVLPDEGRGDGFFAAKLQRAPVS